MLAITLGEGLARPQGTALALPAAAALAEALRSQPARAERWWAPVTWLRDYRLAANWQSSSAAAVDVDYTTKDTAPAADEVERLVELARSGALPGSLFHLTPHGCRVVFAYDTECRDRGLAIAAQRGAGALVARAIAGLPYRVDEPLLGDLGRLFFTPNAIAKGVARAADVLELRAEPYAPAELAKGVAAAVAAPARAPAPATSFQVAAERWNAAHVETWPKAVGDCPICGHRGCFGQLPENPAKWFCWSTQHTAGGTRTDKGWVGDALDVDAALRGLTPAQVLVDDGYLAMARSRAPASSAAPSSAAPATVTPIDRGRRAYRNNSYLTAVQIVETNDREVLGTGARLEYDEMAGRVTLNRKPLEDVDELRVRAEIERRHVGGVDDHGNQKGLKVSLGDVRQALHQVARERPYHPVREYLSGLVWDGTPRLDAVAEDILGAERTVLNQALVRRYMVSAVARAMQPGCKVDTALILVGPTGLGKSTFFRVIGSPWFVDTMLDVTSAKALMTLRRAWIYEWAELEVMRRAEDINTVKALITSPTDEYVPQYGHHAVEVPRGFVIAGTTESDEFLVDEKGNRRFWPLRVTALDLVALREQRDQLWAEAASLYAAWVAGGADVCTTPWVLSPEESRALDPVHAEYQATDSWSDFVVAWAEKQLGEFTTSDVLEHAIQKPRAQRNRGDDMRVAAILKRAGWRLGKKPEGRSKPWVKK